MHLAQALDLPDPYLARPYSGRDDHGAMAIVLSAYWESIGDSEHATPERLDATYGHMTTSDPMRDVCIVEFDGDPVGYCRASREDLASGTRDLIVFSPLVPGHLVETVFRAVVTGAEQHLATSAGPGPARYRAFAAHPGPDLPAVGPAAWLESLGYAPTEWGASLRRPTLDDIPARTLPDGVEVRPVEPDQTRAIFDAETEAFLDEWDGMERGDTDFEAFMADPTIDTSLWKVAWAGDTVVGQVKTYVNHEENALRGYRRGYTEFISTHPDWRGKGIAGALLAMSLAELRDRGFTEAVLGVDTNNPGGAFGLYTRLGFEVEYYEAVYTKPVDPVHEQRAPAPG